MKPMFARSLADPEPDVRTASVRTAAGNGVAFIRCVLTTLSFLFFFGVPAKANTYYVSQSGSDANSCATAKSTTRSNQKLTISAGVACLSAGDILLIHAGTYTGSLNIVNGDAYTVASGTATSPITISAYPGGLAASKMPGPRPGAEVVILIPPNGYPGILLGTTGTPSYLIFEDFVINMVNTPAAYAADGIYESNGASNNTFLHLESKNSGADGIGMSTNSNKILYCLLHDNGVDQSVGNPGYGIYGGGNDNIVEGNDIYQNHGYGIQFNGEPMQANRNIIRNNKIHDNYAWNALQGVGGLSGGGLTIEGHAIGLSDANQVYDNLIYGNGYGGGGTTAGNGIQVYGNSTGTMVYNNTVYNSNGYGIFLQYYDSSSPPSIRNNILYLNHDGPLYDYGALNGSTNTPIIDHNLSTDPSFVNPGATPPDLHIQFGSAAKDTGATIVSVSTDYDTVVRPQGNAYDIGAYEYRGTPPGAPNDLSFIP
jgi:hypothetical protein